MVVVVVVVVVVVAGAVSPQNRTGSMGTAEGEDAGSGMHGERLTGPCR